MKSSLLCCLLALLLTALILAACQSDNPDVTNSGSQSITASPTTVDPTQRPTPAQTTSLPIPDTSDDPANTTATAPTDTAPDVSTLDEPVTVPPVTTVDSPVETTVPIVTTTTPKVTTTTVPITTAPLDPDSEWIVVNTDDYLNLRKTASTASQILTRIPAGDSVEVLGFSGFFAKVRYYQYTGYVYASYITRIDGAGTDTELTVLKPVQNYSYEQMQTDLKILAEEFPDRLSLSTIGKSEEGRDLTLCLLGNPEAERNILMQAAIHAREHVVTQIAVGEIDYILHHQDMVLDNGMTVAELLDSVCIHIVPMSNPDGVTINQTGVMPAPFDDYYSSGTSSIWKANAKGVDLNANFDAFWDRYGSIYDSYVPSYAGYRGTAPECAAESKALGDYLRSMPFDLTLSYHTSGTLIYWSFDYENHPEVNQKSYEVAKYLSAKNGFTLGEQATNSTAGFKDYAMQTLGIPSLTIEFSMEDSPAPLSEFELTWARAKETLLTCAQWVLAQE